jgi:hypothetical protein
MASGRIMARNFPDSARGISGCEVSAVRGERSTIYTDGAGRRWRVRELLRPNDSTDASDPTPPIARATLVFEARGERRFVKGAPIDWRDRRASLADLFVKARPLRRLETP